MAWNPNLVWNKTKKNVAPAQARFFVNPRGDERVLSKQASVENWGWTLNKQDLNRDTGIRLNTFFLRVSEWERKTIIFFNNEESIFYNPKFDVGFKTARKAYILLSC